MAINAQRGTLDGLDSGRLPLSVTFGTEDKQFNNLLDVLSGDSNLLGEGRFPFEYATSASGSELLAMLSDRARVGQPQLAFDQFTRFIATLADEADKGPLSRGIFERIISSGDYPDMADVLQKGDPRLVRAMNNLDSLRNPTPAPLPQRFQAAATIPRAASGWRGAASGGTAWAALWTTLLLAGCAGTDHQQPSPMAPPSDLYHLAAPEAGACAWFGDARNDVLYFGVAGFWSELRAAGGDDLPRHAPALRAGPRLPARPGRGAPRGPPAPPLA